VSFHTLFVKSCSNLTYLLYLLPQELSLNKNSGWSHGYTIRWSVTSLTLKHVTWIVRDSDYFTKTVYLPSLCMWNFCEMLYYLMENMVYQSSKLHVWVLIGLGGTSMHYWHYLQRNCTTVQHVKPVNGESKSWTVHLIWEGLIGWRYLGMPSLTFKWLGWYLNFGI
jgi:hypothetical protein